MPAEINWVLTMIFVHYNHNMSVTSVQFAVATHLMAALGMNGGAEATTAMLAESVNAEPTFVRKSVSKLVKAGLVITTRGKNGACALARPPEEITLRDIYLASEAPTAIAVHAYPTKKTCVVSSNFKDCMAAIQCEVQHTMEQALEKITLAQLIASIQIRGCPKT